MSRSPTYTRSMSISHDMGFMPINNPRAGISTAETLAEMPNLGDDLAKSWKRMQISRSRNQDGKQENTCQVLDWDLSAGQIVRHIERSLGTSLVINSNLIVGDMRPMGNIRISPVTLSPPDGYFCVGPSVLVTPASHLFAPPLPTTSEAGEAAASAYDRAVEAATAASLSAPTTANPFTDPSVALVTAPDNSAVSGAIKAVATLYLRHSSADPDDLELQWLHIKSESIAEDSAATVGAGAQGANSAEYPEETSVAAALAAAESCSNADWLPLKLGEMAHDSMITAPLPGFGLFRCVQRIKSEYEPANLVRIRANGALDIVRANGGEEHRVAPHLVDSEQPKQAGASGGTTKPPPPKSKRDSMTFETLGQRKHLRPAVQSSPSSDGVDTLAPLPSQPAGSSSASKSSDRKSRRRPSAQIPASGADSTIGKKRHRTAPTVYRRLLRAVGLGKSMAPGDSIKVRRFIRENVQFRVFLHGIEQQLGTGAQGTSVGGRRDSRLGSRGIRGRSTSVSRSRSGSMMSDVLQDTPDVPPQLPGSIVTLRVWACANRPDQQWLMRVRQRTMELLEAAPDPGQESDSASQTAQCPRDFAEVARGTFLAHAGEEITMQVDAAPLGSHEMRANDATMASLTGARAVEAAADAAARSSGNGIDSPRHLPQSKTVDVEQLRWQGTPTFVDFDVRLPDRDTIALSADSSDDTPTAPTFTLWLLSKFAEPNKLSAVELSLMDADDIAMAQEAGADEGPTHRVRVDIPIPLLPRESGQFGGMNLQVPGELDKKILSAPQIGATMSAVAEIAEEED